MTDKMMSTDGSFGDDNLPEVDELENETTDGLSDSPVNQRDKKGAGTAKKSSGLGVSVIAFLVIGLVLAAAAIYIFLFAPSAEPKSAQSTLTFTNVDSLPVERKEKVTKEETQASASRGDNLDTMAPQKTNKENALEEQIAAQKNEINELRTQVQSSLNEIGQKSQDGGEIQQTLNQILERQSNLESAMKKSLEQADKQLRYLNSENENIKSTLLTLGEKIEKIEGEQTKKPQKPSERPRVTGSDIEVVSVTSGFAFLRMKSSGKEFSLQIGEGLRGYGEVKKITSLGCIYAGSERIEPVGAVCEL